ncbi:MAG: hypothetical protein F2599_02985, partial [Actinobacteria bacterium]|nr:hypothetical protein [Actinomycetota bacterium]
MNKFLSLIRNWRVGSTLTLLFLVVVWSTPTVGLLITALRDRDEAAASGWWEAVFNPLGQTWSLDSFAKAIDGGMLNALIA